MLSSPASYLNLIHLHLVYSRASLPYAVDKQTLDLSNSVSTARHYNKSDSDLSCWNDSDLSSYRSGSDLSSCRSSSDLSSRRSGSTSPPIEAARTSPPAGTARTSPPAGAARTSPAGAARTSPPAGGARTSPLCGVGPNFKYF